MLVNVDEDDEVVVELVIVVDEEVELEVEVLVIVVVALLEVEDDMTVDEVISVGEDVEELALVVLSNVLETELLDKSEVVLELAVTCVELDVDDCVLVERALVAVELEVVVSLALLELEVIIDVLVDVIILVLRVELDSLVVIVKVELAVWIEVDDDDSMVVEMLLELDIDAKVVVKLVVLVSVDVSEVVLLWSVLVLMPALVRVVDDSVDVMREPVEIEFVSKEVRMVVEMENEMNVVVLSVVESKLDVVSVDANVGVLVISLALVDASEAVLLI